MRREELVSDYAKIIFEQRNNEAQRKYREYMADNPTLLPNIEIATKDNAMKCVITRHDSTESLTLDYAEFLCLISASVFPVSHKISLLASVTVISNHIDPNSITADVTVFNPFIIAFFANNSEIAIRVAASQNGFQLLLKAIDFMENREDFYQFAGFIFQAQNQQKSLLECVYEPSKDTPLILAIFIEAWDDLTAETISERQVRSIIYKDIFISFFRMGKEVDLAGFVVMFDKKIIHNPNYLELQNILIGMFDIYVDRYQSHIISFVAKANQDLDGQRLIAEIMSIALAHNNYKVFQFLAEKAKTQKIDLDEILEVKMKDETIGIVRFICRQGNVEQLRALIAVGLKIVPEDLLSICQHSNINNNSDSIEKIKCLLSRSLYQQMTAQQKKEIEIFAEKNPALSNVLRPLQRPEFKEREKIEKQANLNYNLEALKELAKQNGWSIESEKLAIKFVAQEREIYRFDVKILNSKKLDQQELVEQIINPALEKLEAIKSEERLVKEEKEAARLRILNEECPKVPILIFKLKQEEHLLNERAINQVFTKDEKKKSLTKIRVNLEFLEQLPLDPQQYNPQHLDQLGECVKKLAQLGIVVTNQEVKTRESLKLNRVTNYYSRLSQAINRENKDPRPEIIEIVDQYFNDDLLLGSNPLASQKLMVRDLREELGGKIFRTYIFSALPESVRDEFIRSRSVDSEFEDEDKSESENGSVDEEVQQFAAILELTGQVGSVVRTPSFDKLTNGTQGKKVDDTASR
ncbi:MAG: hypothetical protein V4612_01315 [Pseudomonadota bacterium]